MEELEHTVVLWVSVGFCLTYSIKLAFSAFGLEVFNDLADLLTSEVVDVWRCILQ